MYPPPPGFNPTAFPATGQGLMPGPGYAVYPGPNDQDHDGPTALLIRDVATLQHEASQISRYEYATNPPYSPPSIAGSNGNDSNDFAASSFNDKNVRRKFVSKVYAILTAQLLVALAFVLLCLFYKPIRPWVRRNKWSYWISYVLFLVTYWTLGCCPSVRRRFPGNFIALGVFTLALSYMAGVVSCFHGVNYILFCLIMTAGVTLCVSLAAIACPCDITKCQFLLAVISILFLIFGLVCMIVFWFWGYTRVLHAVYGGVGAVVFSIYLAYDTQLLIGGHRYELSPEDYVVGAMDLFVDVVEIFFSLVALFNSEE
nr:unnamed protein product [Spirometra erinaceieuropaei]